MNAFYICGLEAKYAEEFNRNTRRLSQTGESSEVWPISKNRKAPQLNKLGSLSPLWCEAELKTGGDCARGQSYLRQAPLWRVAKLKTGGRVSCMDSLWQEARLKTEDMSHTHCGLLAETFFPSPGARLSLIFRVRFGHSGQTSQFVTCLMDYLLVSTFYVRMTNYIVLAFRDTCLLLYHSHDGKVICFLLSVFFKILNSKAG